MDPLARTGQGDEHIVATRGTAVRVPPRPTVGSKQTHMHNDQPQDTRHGHKPYQDQTLHRLTCSRVAHGVALPSYIYSHCLQDAHARVT
jgi:hypothetical protein